jgi:arylsulfatase A-like enzyme
MKTPYVHGSDHQLRKLRQHYYATVSWADYACGQILRELDALKLTESTMVVLHSDQCVTSTRYLFLPPCLHDGCPSL